MKDKNQLLLTPQGRILLFGICIVVLILISGVILFFIDADLAKNIFGLIITNITVGRVPSLSLGYAGELPHMVVIGANFLAEMTMVLILYPLFVLSFNKMLNIKHLENHFKNIIEYKKKHQELFDKYGILGLFIFVFIPFWMTGPIVGSMIGYLIGVKHLLTMIIIATATLIAITLWGVFLQEIITFVKIFDQFYLWIFIAVIITVFIIIRIKKEK